MNKPMRQALWVFLATTAVGIVALLLLLNKVRHYPDTATGSAKGTVEIEIPKGANARQVSELLASAGLLDSPTYFRLYASQRGVTSRFKAGRYHVPAPITPRKLIETMIQGAADELVTVTVPEGKNVLEVVDILDAAGIAPKSELLAQVMDPAFARSLDLPSLEGYLFPDTYRLRPHTPAARALVTLVRRHRQVFAELSTANASGLAALKGKLGFDDLRVVTLASIVEKETGQPEERPRIAQVFINRLSKPNYRPKLLQTDPTIIYGCTVAPQLSGKPSAACAQWDGRIRRIHLDDQDNLYNTYTHEGLPPGPIANPGRAALAAVMHPDGSPYLYFVSKNDGTHQFSTTLAEHEAAVVKYQRGGKPLSKATP
jgi:UPF0755 protein